jgi:hypothetical protein
MDKKTNLKKFNIGAIAMLAIAILCVGGWKLWNKVNPKSTATAPLSLDCELQESSCSSTFSDGTEISLSIDPQPIPNLKKLTLNTQINGLEAEKVEVDIVGIGMNMGYIRPALSKTQVKGRFTGESILPVCIIQEMQWEARVMAYTDKGLLIAPFRFKTFNKK